MDWKQKIVAWAIGRSPDVVIGGHDDPYMYRWYLIPKNRFFNVYVHWFMRSDDDRALHDHPWSNLSILLDGQYTEHRISAGGIHNHFLRKAGDWCIRVAGSIAHRIELTHGTCFTLFITGPKYREWGFHCPQQGWVHWKKFTAADDPGAIGLGCNQTHGKTGGP